ncbi:MAG: hypothetical protein KatS3mg119_0865 [Rhodothalassiaceae bacterium]|nr:MAG: hypothetical protein KatS3mg119_0865 [Rhodothalassiaceae bacterium]
MADITRINGIAPPGLPRELKPVEPAPAVTRRQPQPQASGQEPVSGPGRSDGTAGTDAGGPVLRDDRSPQDVAGALEKKLEGILKEVLGADFASRRLSIAQDEATGRFVYRVIDVNTGEVLRQYPPDEILRIVAQIREAEGLVLDSEA